MSATTTPSGGRWSSVPGGKLHPHLQGNWGPVGSESHEPALPTSSGRLPADLVGQYLRVGPNLQFLPSAKAMGQYHMFAGDGMVHSVRVDGGRHKASYANRWVRTPKFAAERAAQQLLRPPIPGEEGRKGGLANTALVFHSGRLLALEEGHVPVALEALADGDLATRGCEDFEGRLDHEFTAHPKVDPVTGEMVFFGYNVERRPYCNYGVVDRSGKLVTQLALDYEKPVMMHDCAITENYSVIMLLPLLFKPEIVPPFALGKSEPSRFAIFPRHAKSAQEVVWFEYGTASFGYHTANAWEEGETLHVVHVTDDSFDFVKNGVGTDLKLVRWSFHLPTRRVSRVTLLDRQVEFPIMNPRFVGRRSSFAYVLLFGEDARLPEAERPRLPKYKAAHIAKGYLWGVAKVDVVQGREVGRFLFGEDMLGTECSFAPKKGSDAEDAGYLVTILRDCANDTSFFAVYDAETMAPDPLCTLALPARVPFGFHALWVQEEELLQQRQGVALEPLYKTPGIPARL